MFANARPIAVASLHVTGVVHLARVRADGRCTWNLLQSLPNGWIPAFFGALLSFYRSTVPIVDTSLEVVFILLILIMQTPLEAIMLESIIIVVVVALFALEMTR